MKIYDERRRKTENTHSAKRCNATLRTTAKNSQIANYEALEIATIALHRKAEHTTAKKNNLKNLRRIAKTL
jgi:hypothetical protein